MRDSLRELAEFVESDPRYRDVWAFTGEMGGVPIRGAQRLASVGGRYGFESRLVEPPHGLAGAYGVGAKIDCSACWRGLTTLAACGGAAPVRRAAGFG